MTTRVVIKNDSPEFYSDGKPYSKTVEVTSVDIIAGQKQELMPFIVDAGKSVELYVYTGREYIIREIDK